MWGRHGSCGSVDHTPSPPLHWPSRQLVSDLVDRRASAADHAEAGNEAVAEAVGGIAATPEDAFGRISEVDVDLVGVVCQMTRTRYNMQLVVIALAS